MGVVRTVMLVMVWCLCLLGRGYAQTVTRIPIASISSSVATGQDYTPWLNDDVTSLVANVWAPVNMQWVDVKLKLATPATISKLRLYDYEGTFEAYPVQIYAVSGGTKTLINTFLGLDYMAWKDIAIPSVMADTIIVHKYGNCIPQKIQMYGVAVPSTTGTGGTTTTGTGGTTTGTGGTTTGSGGSTSSGVYTLTGSATVCVGASTPWGCLSTGGTWKSSNTAVATVSSTSGYVHGVAAGTATITYKKTGSIGTRVVTVVATPSAGTISGASSVTAGGAITLTDATPGGVWSSSAPTVATVNSSGLVTGIAAGTSVISYTVSNACGSVSATKTITIAAAAAPVISGASSVCAGATTALTASVAGGAWSSSATGVATVSSTGVVSGVSAGTATISYTVSGVTATKVVTVNVAPSAGTISGASSVTAGATTALTSSAAGGSWSSSSTGVATVSTTGVVTGVAAGTATISYVVSGSCGNATATQVVTVNSAPVTTPAISGTASVCAGATTALTASVSGGAWSSSSTGVATVNTSGVVTGVSAGTATISYAITGAVGTKVVTVNPAPSAGSISGTTSLTVGASTALTASVSGGTWSSSATGVASVNSAGSVTGISAGSATISYTVSNSCGSAVATTVVNVAPPASSGGGSGSTGGVGSGTMMSGKIPIEAKRWYQLNNCNNGLQGLFDGNLTTAINTGYGKILTNFDAYYPVNPGEKMNITSVKFYDGPGSNETQPFKLYYIDSAWNRVLIGTYIGTQYNMWVGPDASNPTNFTLPVPANNVRYLVINCSSVYPLEMELYGTYMTASPVVTPSTRPITLKQELGVNAFEWDFLNPSNPLVIDNTRMNAIRSFGCVRHYLDWQKLEPTSGGYTFNPSHSGGWNMDTIYAKAKAEGIEMLVDIKTIPDWLQATYPSGSADGENVPVPYGSDFTNPNSYIKQAKLGFQFAARYGSNTSVSSSLLSVDASTRWGGDPANVVRKGLNYVKYIECDNERDKWWKGRKAYQTGREYAANMSAFYDGHKGSMGAGVGVKNADPNMQVVMGGIALPTVDYVMGMIDWCKEFRGYNADGTVNLCWDVINYHIYPDNATSMQGGGTQGAAPEGRADTFAKRFVDMSRQYAKGMPVWVTETGYDLNQSSSIKAIPIGSKTPKITQADWSLRNSLMYARMGVERCFFYMLDDVDSNSSTVFSSCGLVSPNYSRRPVADYMYQTKRLMGDYVYKETISTNPIVDRYELGGTSIYVLVKPTQNGTTMPYTLSLPIATGTARIYTPTVNQDSMSMSTATISGSTVALTASETPIFIKVSASGAKPAGEEPTVDVIRQADASVIVYPNPTTGTVNFVIDNQFQGAMPVTIYTEGGQVVRTMSMSKPAGKYTNTVDLSYLPNGLYIVEIGRGQDRVTKKIIKVN